LGLRMSVTIEGRLSGIIIRKLGLAKPVQEGTMAPGRKSRLRRSSWAADRGGVVERRDMAKEKYLKIGRVKVKSALKKELMRTRRDFRKKRFLSYVSWGGVRGTKGGIGRMSRPGTRSFRVSL